MMNLSTDKYLPFDQNRTKFCDLHWKEKLSLRTSFGLYHAVRSRTREEIIFLSCLQALKKNKSFARRGVCIQKYNTAQLICSIYSTDFDRKNLRSNHVVWVFQNTFERLLIIENTQCVKAVFHDITFFGIDTMKNTSNDREDIE